MSFMPRTLPAYAALLNFFHPGLNRHGRSRISTSAHFSSPASPRQLGLASVSVVACETLPNNTRKYQNLT